MHWLPLALHVHEVASVRQHSITLEDDVFFNMPLGNDQPVALCVDVRKDRRRRASHT